MRPSWVDVDLSAVAQNVAAISSLMSPARLCAVVKADGYGHGDVPVAQAAVEAGAEWLAVALVSEGIGLREAGIEAPVLVLSEPDPAEAAEMVRWRLTPTVYSEGMVRALAAVAPSGYPVHLKVDTGMHRVGAEPAEARRLAHLVDDGPLRLESVWTHFPVADEDLEFTRAQADTLEGFVASLTSEGVEVEMMHAANTAAAFAGVARFDMVRVGLGIYGLYPEGVGRDVVSLRPAMTMRSKVARVARLPAGARPSYGRRRALQREATVVTVPVGYADGLSRGLSERGSALIGGRRHPFAGTITMDQAVIDVGDMDVSVGDEVVLLGSQGDETITVEEWAALLGTITWEVVCGFGPRLPRRHMP